MGRAGMEPTPAVDQSMARSALRMGAQGVLLLCAVSNEAELKSRVMRVPGHERMITSRARRKCAAACVYRIIAGHGVWGRKR